ncbi:helix-turn-helix domain-containing protein [Pseudomonas phoenicis]|uniref:helix-turn-helix domain-containing protein n=1 Tax=unclassified Pseudomonas TaxID=196821 RepID=UPI0039A2C5FA
MKTIHSTPYQRLLALLVDARKAANMTQQELSQRLGRPQSYVSKYERGERRLDVIEFMDIARYIQADPYGLLRQVDSMLMDQNS